MAMTRVVNGVTVEISPEEEASIVAEWNVNAVQTAENAWIEKRRVAYGSYGEQFDMMYHDAREGTQTWLEHVAGVKVMFPKKIGFPS